MASHLIIDTLRKRADFLRLNRGRKYVAPGFILRALPQPDAGVGAARIGYTVTTKCGNAVMRNRIKRRLRAAVQAVLPEHARMGMDYVLIARADADPSPARIPFEELKTSLTAALGSIHRNLGL